MIGTLVNCGAVILGGTIGLIIKRGLSEKTGASIMQGLALCVMYIGISGALEGKNILIVILSIAIGALIGETVDFDARLNKLGDTLESKLSNSGGKFSQGFVTASLLFCVGAMAIVGSLQSGISGNHETLFAKSLIDAISAMVLASTFGTGVIFSAVAVFVYQGAITVGAGLLEPILTETIISEMTCVGSLLIIGLSLNMMNITKIKVMNYIPAVFIPIIIYCGMELFK